MSLAQILLISVGDNKDQPCSRTWLKFTSSVVHSHGNLITGGVKHTAVKKTDNFDVRHYLSWKWYEISPWLLWITNRKSQVVDRSILVQTIFFGQISIHTLLLFDVE